MPDERRVYIQDGDDVTEYRPVSGRRRAPVAAQPQVARPPSVPGAEPAIGPESAPDASTETATEAADYAAGFEARIRQLHKRLGEKGDKRDIRGLLKESDKSIERMEYDFAEEDREARFGGIRQGLAERGHDMSMRDLQDSSEAALSDMEKYIASASAEDTLIREEAQIRAVNAKYAEKEAEEKVERQARLRERIAGKSKFGASAYDASLSAGSVLGALSSRVARNARRGYARGMPVLNDKMSMIAQQLAASQKKLAASQKPAPSRSSRRGAKGMKKGPTQAPKIRVTRK